MKRRNLIAVAATAGIVLTVVGSPGPAGSLGGPLPVPETLVVTASRTVAAGGQVIEFAGPGGCSPGGHSVVVNLYTGTGIDYAADFPVAVAEADAETDGSFVVPLVLWQNTGSGNYEVLPEGQYTAATWCSFGEEYIQTPGQVITVSGTRPSDEMQVDNAPGTTPIDVAGAACSYGQVEVGLIDIGDETPGDNYELHDVVDPEVDGSWTYVFSPRRSGRPQITATCGDPTDDGFVYAPISLLVAVPEPPVPTVIVPPTTPTSVPAGPQTPNEAPGAAAVPGSPDFTG